MRTFPTLALLLIGLSYAVSTSAQDEEELKEGAIDARQGEMQLRSFNAGPLFAMAKGDMDYDAEMASKLANNLKIMLSLDNGRAWMKGTSNEEYPEETGALPAVWESGSEIGERGEAYAKAVNELAEAAGGGLDTLTPKVKNLGQACKDCHDDYREDD